MLRLVLIALSCLATGGGKLGAPGEVMGAVDVGVGYNTGRLKIETFPDRTYTTSNGEELGDDLELDVVRLGQVDALVEVAMLHDDLPARTRV